MEKIGIIELEGMEFKAYHGCLEQEKVRGNLFTVDFRGELDLSAAAESDNLNDTLNYGEIYEIVADEMKLLGRRPEGAPQTGYSQPQQQTYQQPSYQAPQQPASQTPQQPVYQPEPQPEAPFIPQNDPDDLPF